MESKRRHEKIKIQTEIKDLDMYNKADSITISRLKTSGTNIEFNKRQITKLCEKIQEREGRLVLLKVRFNNVITGVLDEELISQSKNVQDEIQRKTDEKLKHKAELAASKKVDKERSQAFYQSNLKSMRQERRNTRDVNRTYLYYKRICASIPDYMRRKLASMPENKGYVWKGVHCYGEKPAERNRPVSLSERPRGGETLLIHEWTSDEYRLYKKIGKGPKTLSRTEPRKN